MFLLNSKTALRSNEDERMQSVDSIGTYVFRMNKNLVCKKGKNVTK